MKSIRWRLQLWHALVLTVVLSIFGGIVSVLQWQSRMQQVDAELDRTTRVVFSQLRYLLRPPAGLQPGWGGGRSSRGDRRPDSSPQRNDAVRTDATRTDADKPRPEPEVAFQGPEGPTTGESKSTGKAPESPRQPTERGVAGRDGPGRDGPGREQQGRGRFGLPAEFVEMFDGDDESRQYFAIWGHDGKLLQKSASAPEDIPFPGLKSKDGVFPPRLERQRGDLREVAQVGLFDLNVLVGRSIRNDVAEHRMGVLLLLASGAGVLVVGLLGGGWLSSRAVRPISAMTAAAQSISARNLTGRIDVQEVDNELGELATVLNGTFDRLQSAFEQQARFTADASHELRTPVAVILANAELALSKPRTTDAYRQALETCRRASQRMKSLIESLLILARFDTGEPSLETRSLDLGPLVEESLDMLRPLAEQRKLTLECRASSVRLVGDRERLSQVFTNLLTNAIRYNVEAGRIEVTVTEDAGQAVVTVTDTGIGIPPEDLPHVFDRFFRVDKARSRAEGGSGLGLSICRTIVEAHGGVITARSQPQVGSTFEVRLPLNRVPEPTRSVSEAGDQATSSIEKQPDTDVSPAKAVAVSGDSDPQLDVHVLPENGSKPPTRLERQEGVEAWSASPPR